MQTAASFNVAANLHKHVHACIELHKVTAFSNFTRVFFDLGPRSAAKEGHGPLGVMKSKYILVVHRTHDDSENK